MTILVLLSDGTTGTCGALSKVGDWVLVFYRDENARPMQKFGEVLEIL